VRNAISRPHYRIIGRMTQQDETDRNAATDESVPSRPSPYLDAGGAAPQAYLAPPQPDQPSYGTPPAYRARLRTGGSGRQPYVQRGYDQEPGSGQPRYGQAGNRPLGGARSRRDPAIAAPWERLAACILDWIFIVAVSVLAFWSPLARVLREFQAITTNYQSVNSPAAQAAINSMARDPANQHALLYWFLGMFGIALAYYWIQHAAWGATIGKRALGVRVVQAADQSRISVRAAGIRTVTFLAGPAVFLLLASPINVAGGLLWAADTALPLLDPRAQCLHDKLAGTIVIRQRWLDQQARSARPW
jgi:uncharacterized RDD family membrane protein YckC